MKIKSIRKAVLLLALLTSTSFAAGKNVNVEFRKGHSSAQYSGGGIIFVGAGFHIHDKVRGTLCINITTGKVRCWIIR